MEKKTTSFIWSILPLFWMWPCCCCKEKAEKEVQTDDLDSEKGITFKNEEELGEFCKNMRVAASEWMSPKTPLSTQAKTGVILIPS